MKLWKRLLIGLAVVFVIAAGAFVVWGLNPLPAMPEALAALAPDDMVMVTETPWLEFAPRDQHPTIGFVLYPGGHVDPRAYAPPARAIAEHGYLVAIPPMPLNLAVLAPGRAASVMEAHPEIDRWVIGGHSLGGAMAANFAYRHPNAVSGIVLWASYPAGSNPLGDLDLPVLSIYGTEDMGLDGILANRDLLPADTEWVVIDGGNHAQFGWYGDQPGDNEALISREEQQQQIIEATIRLLEAMEAAS